MSDKHPDHIAEFDFPTDRYIVKLGDTIIAESTNVVLLKEKSPRGSYPHIPYFPLNDVNTELLTQTDHTTYCPLKGDASYYTLTADGQTLENAVWYYPDPLKYVAEIDNTVAFYPGKFTIIREHNVSTEILTGYAAMRNS